MRLIIIVFIERLHRYLYDTWFFAKEDPLGRYKKVNLKFHIINFIYNILVKKYYNWRFELHQSFPGAKNLIRYSNFDRGK